MKRQLNLFQDPQGRWCCEGRIHNANLPYSTQLVVLRDHERVFHNGVKETLTEIRSQYWITNGRAVVQKLIHSCITCWRLEALAHMAPRPPPLPPLRVTEALAFTYEGINFAGPLHVKRVGSKTEDNKVLICSFTCCMTLAIHLDRVPDLTTGAFLCCFKRFVVRRRVPTKMVSDNGKTFKSAAKLLTDPVMNELKNHLLSLYVKWTFNMVEGGCSRGW